MTKNPYVSILIACAHCGKNRAEANHWFVLRAGTFKPLLYTVRPLEPASFKPSPGDQPACGEACLFALEGKLISAFTQKAVRDQGSATP